MVLGLGNPGARYERTRHNAGYLVADRLREAASCRWTLREQWQEASVRFGAEEILLVRPTTFMNRSGDAADRILAERHLDSSELLVVTDDVALPAGRLRIRAAGSPGGHRGLLSIRDRIGSDAFPRLRIGVGAPDAEGDLAEYVLAPLEGAEWEEFVTVIERAVEAVRMICLEGVGKAMNVYNPAPPGIEETRA